MKYQMVRRTGHPDFLDLPWNQPLERWKTPRLVEIEAGLSRHVVRFVRYDEGIYALKELPKRLAEREYRLLSELARMSIPVVEAAGVVTDRAARPNTELDAILITRHLDFSMPYRAVLASPGFVDLGNRLLDSLANLLVRLHIAGFYWGDCSLSNTLFRRDAGALAAYVVDVETGELHPTLSRGQRETDLMIAEENMAGELLDMSAARRLPAGIDPDGTAAQLGERYGFLWSELTREEVIPSDRRYLIDDRLSRLNALGFDVDEVELVADGDGYRLRVQPHVVEPDHHARTLQALTGLQVQENQARRILNDLAQYRARLQGGRATRIPDAVVGYRWLNEVFEPTVQSIPPKLRGRLDPAELYHELLEHRWFLSEAAGHDVGLDEAVRSFTENVLSKVPEPATEAPAPGS